MSIVRYKSPLRWPGGKTRAVKRLRELMPDLSQIQDYREPFTGGGSVFLHIKSELPPRGYVWLNDLFKPLQRFWTAAQVTNELLSVCSELNLDISDKRFHFESLKDVSYKFWTPDDLFFMNRCAYSGNICGGFSETAARERFTLSSVERIRDIKPALEDAAITCQDYTIVLNSPAVGSKSSETFIFLDPPYLGIKGLYPVSGAGEFDHYRLEYWLRKCQFKFMLTYNDVPEVRNLYNWANIEPLVFQYGMDNVGGNKPKKAKELIIRNYVV